MPKSSPRPPRTAVAADDLPFAGFDAAALRFLRGLKRRNEREWFEAHRAEYDQFVRTPMRALIEELDVHLAAHVPELVGDPKRSIFRIHRDVRFSTDKSPYKTHASAWLFHEDAGRVVGQQAHGGAGVYVHLEPGASMVAGGIWMPPKAGLDKLRDRLAEAHEGFEAIVLERGFRRRFGDLDAEAVLVRPPRGVDPMHPAIRWLKYKSFTVSRPLEDAVMTSPRLVPTLAKDIAALTPFVRWLNDALGFPSRSTRS